MENYKVTSINRGDSISHIYQKRNSGHYKRLFEEIPDLLTEIARNNEQIIKKSRLKKLKVNLEVTIYSM